MIVLSWLASDSSKWKQYVANRVALIKELTPEVHFHHVPGSGNPADINSRGSFPQ